MRNAFLFCFLLIFLVACAPQGEPRPGPVACIEDAKLCPDGSAVGRVAPDCNFAPCPELGSDFCKADDDCICDGIDPETDSCFVGNKNYYGAFVDKETQCADFCTGIDGRLQTKCVDDRCALIRGEPPKIPPSLELVAEPAFGEAPLRVHFTATLRGVENEEEFFCVGRTWDFGIGEVMTAMPGCVPYSEDIPISRNYEGDYHYEKPGVYQVTFTLGELQSNTITVTAMPELLPPECDEDSDCVPAQCCHAADCIIKEKRADCSRIFCTQECRQGSIDCGGGCACVAGRCTGQNFYEGETTVTGKVPWQLI